MSGVKLHFTTDSYDYVQYGGKVNCKLETFTKRNDRYFFHKLKKYNEEQALDFFVSNFCTMIKNGLATLPSLMETTYTYLIEGIKILLVIILGVSVILLGILWGITSYF